MLENNLKKCVRQNCNNFVVNIEETGMFCKSCSMDNFYTEKNNKLSRESLDTARNNTLKYKYGITQIDYEQLFKKQNFSCLICKKGNGTTVRFPVDHCHKTGKVRGILCPACNKALGLFKDNIEALESAIDYLKKNKL
jgi:hypothetical protein